MQRTVTVGCTGMLAGVTRTLASRGHMVDVLARRPEPLHGEGLRPKVVDWRNPTTFDA